VKHKKVATAYVDIIIIAAPRIIIYIYKYIYITIIIMYIFILLGLLFDTIIYIIAGPN
tara:strand:- start:1859 stop:2032 length:174 start_codon:yes stop_codon:yes gene_type:complete